MKKRPFFHSLATLAAMLALALPTLWVVPNVSDAQVALQGQSDLTPRAQRLAARQNARAARVLARRVRGGAAIAVTVVRGKDRKPVNGALIHFRRLVRGHFRNSGRTRTSATGVSLSKRRVAEFRLFAHRAGVGHGRAEVTTQAGVTSAVTIVLHGERRGHLHEKHALGIRVLHESRTHKTTPASVQTLQPLDVAHRSRSN